MLVSAILCKLEGQSLERKDTVSGVEENRDAQVRKFWAGAVRGEREPSGCIPSPRLYLL